MQWRDVMKETLDIRNILIPIDFSKHAIRALDLGVYLAQLYQAEVHLLHSLTGIEDGPWGALQNSPEAKVLHQSSRKMIDDLLTYTIANHTREGVVISPVITGGRAATQIVEHAQKNPIDLIVLGSHGHGGIRRFLLGSKAEEIAHTASCSVLVVHDNEKEKIGVDKILVPIDFSEESEQAIEWAKSLVKGRKASLILMHVVEGNPATEMIEIPQTIKTDVFSVLEKRSREALEDAAEKIRAEGIDVETIIEHGSVARSILDYPKHNPVDLIVMSARGKGEAGHFLMGSISTKVMRNAACPTLVVK